MQVPVSEKTPMNLVQLALLHQCDEASRAIRRKVQEIRELERFAADAHTACFRAGVGDLQFGLLSAGIAPSDLQFPSVPRETQETGCQAEPTTQSTSTQDRPGIRFINQNLMDCNLQLSSTKIMDGYLQEHGYGPGHGGDTTSHPFHSRPHVVRAVSNHFRSVSLIALQITPNSEVQALRDLDREMFPSRPFHGVHLLSYTDNMYPVVLPTHSRHTFITEQLSRTMVQLAELLPQKDCLLSRGEYIKAEDAAVDPAPSESAHRTTEMTSTASETVEAASTASETCPLEAARGGQEMDSCTEVEVAPVESAPSQGVFGPLWVAPQTDATQAVVKPASHIVPTKAQRKTPPPNLVVTIQPSHSPQQSCMESFDLGGDEVPPSEDLDVTLEAGGLDSQPAQTIVATISTNADNNSKCAEGATAAKVIMAPASKPKLPLPELTEEGRVLPPCTVRSFPAPHPGWKMELGEKDLSDLLPKSLPIVQGVLGNRSTALLELDFQRFIPREQLSDSQARLQTTANIQQALWAALIHPLVEKSLLSPPTADDHPGLVTVEDLRCLSPDDRANLKMNGVEFFYPALQEHFTGGSTKTQQYLLSCLVFG